MKFEQKYVTEREDTTTPEHYLWTSVLSKAAHDAIYGSDWREAKFAIEWFKGMGTGFREVCNYAGKDPHYVHRKMRIPIEKREAHMEMVRSGVRLYVKETLQPAKQYHSYYRSTNSTKPPRKRQGRPKKKHLTGNTYYAMKAKKSFYYAGMGSKGGRPRIYNKIEE